MNLCFFIIINEITQQYHLHDIVSDGWMYLEKLKGRYKLIQAGKIDHDELVKHFAPYGYKPAIHTHIYWKHNNKPISFVSRVDNFVIKYFNNQDLDYLPQALMDKYNIKENLTGSLYYEIHLKWDYSKRTVKHSMLNYVKHVLHKFQHSSPTRKQHPLYHCTPSVYCKQTQLVHAPNPSPPLSKYGTPHIQQIVGIFL